MILKKCKYCTEEFSTRAKSKIICDKKECSLLKSKDDYKIKLRIKKCICCDNEFNATIKQKRCIECRKKSEIIFVKQDIKCKYCKSYIKTLTLSEGKYSKHKKEKINRVCQECKIKWRNKWSEQQKGENNTNFNFNKIKKDSMTREQLSQCMMLFNPMYNKETAAKAGKTIKEGYKSGRIKKKIGKDSPLWKGNRKRSYTIRTRLGWWIKEKLHRDNYKCIICDKKKKLEVHHIEPLRNIIYKFTQGYPLNCYNEDEFEELIQKISEYHKNVEGITLCQEHHKQIDPLRK